MQTYRPDRVVKSLTALVTIVFFVFLFAGAVVLLGLPAQKLLGRDVSGWTMRLPVEVGSRVSEAEVLTRWGDRVLVEDMWGSLRLPVSTLPWRLFGVLWTYAAFAFVLGLLFLHQLRRIFQSVRAGAPFDAVNALRIRSLGFLALALWVLQGITELVTFLALRDGQLSEDLDLGLRLGVNGSLAIGGLVLMALAEIFRRGAALEEDRSLTV